MGGAPDRIYIPCLIRDTRIGQIDIKMIFKKLAPKKYVNI